MKTKRVYALLLIALLSANVTTAVAKDIPMVTVENMGRPQTVIDGACVYAEFPGFSFSGDPLMKAVAEAVQKMQKLAEDKGADAVVGFDIDFASRPMKGEEGRVLLCGTFVKFKD